MKRGKTLPVSGRGGSLVRSLRDARERWEDLTELLDVTHAALISEKDWALVIEETANVIYRSVLCPMRDEIRWLGKLILETPEEAKPSVVFTRTVAAEAARSYGIPDVANVLSLSVCNRLSRQLMLLTHVIEQLGGATELSKGSEPKEQPGPPSP